MAMSVHLRGAPRRPEGFAVHALIASGVILSVMSPRLTRAWSESALPVLIRSQFRQSIPAAITVLRNGGNGYGSVPPRSTTRWRLGPGGRARGAYRCPGPPLNANMTGRFRRSLVPERT